MSGISENTISAVDADWSREKPRRYWDPSRRLLKSIRDYQSSHLSWPVFRIFVRYFAVLRHRFWSIVCGCDIPLNCQIGGGLKLTHPNGVVIHPGAQIGVNCLILQQVTIVGGVHVEGQVDIGAGAKIIRPVNIGKHSQIGANAVVLNDIPASSIAVGVPAVIIGENSPAAVNAAELV